MPKLDSNLYGADDNGFAQRISSDALSPKQGDEDIWGSAVDDSAMSHGASEGTTAKTNPVKVVHDKGDGRAKSSGNHGAQD
jgi:hypothetical protein